MLDERGVSIADCACPYFASSLVLLSKASMLLLAGAKRNAADADLDAVAKEQEQDAELQVLNKIFKL